MREIAAELRTRPEDVAAAVITLTQERKRLEQALKQGGGAAGGAGDLDLESLAKGAQELAGASVLAAAVDAPDAKALLAAVDR